MKRWVRLPCPAPVVLEFEMWKDKTFWLKAGAVFLVILLYGFFWSEKINLATADLGRHIKNGEIIMKGGGKDVWYRNFYSYTYNDFPFVNHHWGTGVIFYLLEQVGGFVLLSVFNLVLSLAAFGIFFKMVFKVVGGKITILLSLLLMPIIAGRGEIRPEAFSLLFFSIFIYILRAYRQKRLNKKWLYVLPAIMFFWVNLHVGFVLGWLAFGAFVLFDFGRWQEWLPVGIIMALVGLINPNGIRGLLYPLLIFKGYGYTIVENKSIFFLEKMNITGGQNFGLYKLVVIMVIISCFLAVKKAKVIAWPSWLMFLVLTVMSVMAIRYFPLFGLVAFLVLAENGKVLWSNKKESKPWVLLMVLLFPLVLVNDLVVLSKVSFRGWGLRPGINRAMEFYKKVGIEGPIFNNYDIGGYLIYHLFPKEKVFVDNRPEAYPASSFQEVYIPAQLEESRWLELEKEYGFNAVVFWFRDYTNWAQDFLVRMIDETSWVPVWVDEGIFIMLKRNQKNESIISQYGIPREVFRVVKN